MMVKTLFVCQGNVARSQMAEALYNELSGTKDGYSAGIDPTTPKRYKNLPEQVEQVMGELGISLVGNKVEVVKKKLVKQAEHIYVMCDKGECPKYLQEAQNVEFWNIDDPHGKDIEIFRQIRDEIKEKVLSIINPSS